jgi:hypothetical protein
VAETLARALAPSAAAETWRLDELGRCRGFLLSTKGDPEILRDREEADRRFREALRVILPGTELFRLYLDRLMGTARTSLDRSALRRLVQMRSASLLCAADVDFLLDHDGPERVALASRLLSAFRRYTRYRYLSVWERFQARDQDGEVDLLVPTAGAFDVGLDGEDASTLRADRVLVMARMVALGGGRLHPLVPFDPAADEDPSDSLALVRDAVEELGFLGVALRPSSGVADQREARRRRALLAWCAREEVPVVAGVTHPVAGRAGGKGLAAFLGLGSGQRTRARLERFYARHDMAAPRWMRSPGRPQIASAPLPRNSWPVLDV